MVIRCAARAIQAALERLYPNDGNDGADMLAEAESAIEIWEPQLSADELVAVRVLIEERFPEFSPVPPAGGNGEGGAPPTPPSPPRNGWDEGGPW